MAKVGYVMNYAGYRANTDKEWMKRFGCNEIMEEQQDYELRTEWNKLLDRLNKGDELVVPKLSHVLRETRQLSYLLEYCRLKEIRLISIHDRIDSGNELFPETQMSDILNVVALLPKEAFLKDLQYPTVLNPQVLRCSPQSEKPHENIVPGGLQPHRAERVRGEYV